MSESLSVVEMTTQPRSGTFTIHHYANPEVGLSHRLTVNVVTAMAIDGAAISNPYHFSNIELLEPVDDPAQESVTLPASKAARLLQFYRNLTPEHPHQCHDLVTAVEGWEKDNGLDGVYKVVQPKEHVFDPEDTVVSGNIYNIHIIRGLTRAQEFLRTHSAIGTDDNRLLGLVGKGLMLATMAPDDALEFYREGAVLSFLSRALSFKQ